MDIQNRMSNIFNESDDNETRAMKILKKYEEEKEETQLQESIEGDIVRRTLDGELIRIGYEMENDIIKDIISDIGYEALPLDDEYKSKFKSDIKKEIVKILESIDIDFANIHKVSMLMEHISISSEGIAKEYIKRKRQEIEGNPAPTLEELNNNNIMEEDKTKIIDVEKDIDMKKISEVIKNKVIDTVKEEETKVKEKEDEDTEIADATKELSEGSLFKSIQYKKYKEMVIVDGKIKEENKEFVLAESLLEYTTLELANTLKLKNYTPYDIANLVKENVYNNL